MASDNPAQHRQYGRQIQLGVNQESITTSPPPPSEDERRHYFYGLPSSPTLVARSGNTPWSRSSYPGFPEEKRLEVATGHAIQQPWNEPNSSLQFSIMEALGVLNWTAIDILRVANNNRRKSTAEKPRSPVTMLISVPENSTTFDQGYMAISKCKSVLEDRGLGDVEVEMKESKLSRSTSTSSSPPEQEHGQQLFSFDHERLLSGPLASGIDYKYSFHFTEYIGTNIAALDDRGKEGTKGLYLRDSKNTLYALTCRHVVFKDERLLDNSQVGQDSPDITQPGKRTFNDMQHDFQNEDRDLYMAIHTPPPGIKPDEEGYLKQQQLNRNDFANLQAYKPLLDDHSADGKFSDFGHVEFSPPLQVSNGRLMDWALIKLSQHRHTTELSQLKNKLPVTGLFRETLKSKGIRDTLGFYINSEVTIRPDIISLQNLEAEIQTGDSHRGLTGIMHGGKSGFRIGCINGIKSVVREPVGCVYFTSQEWCTIGLDGGAFSKCGDSGSVIIDIHGRAMLQLTGGIGRDDPMNPAEFDTTYGTPVISVLEDIRSYGYELSLPR